MKLASGAKKGKEKKGKEGNETAVIDVTVTEEVPVDHLEPLPLPRCELQSVFYTRFSSREMELGMQLKKKSPSFSSYTRVMSIMLLHPGLPEHRAAPDKQPRARFLLRALAGRYCPLVCSNVICGPLCWAQEAIEAAAAAAVLMKKENSQFVIYEMFSSSPLIEHGAAEGDARIWQLPCCV